VFFFAHRGSLFPLSIFEENVHVFPLGTPPWVPLPFSRCFWYKTHALVPHNRVFTPLNPLHSCSLLLFLLSLSRKQRSSRHPFLLLFFFSTGVNLPPIFFRHILAHFWPPSSFYGSGFPLHASHRHLVAGPELVFPPLQLAFPLSSTFLVHLQIFPSDRGASFHSPTTLFLKSVVTRFIPRFRSFLTTSEGSYPPRPVSPQPLFPATFKSLKLHLFLTSVS